jgi:hypothetical protein
MSSIVVVSFVGFFVVLPTVVSIFVVFNVFADSVLLLVTPLLTLTVVFESVVVDVDTSLTVAVVAFSSSCARPPLCSEGATRFRSLEATSF